ncbi:MAG: response regulator transcription factor [Nocardioidaceae bacterium]|nr:response regulator transcription factor [Nocardioidaceae bacterium]
MDVLLVDDHDLIRKGFAMILATEDDITVVGEAADGDQAVARARELRPDVILMDVQMPGTDGIAATRQVVEELDAKVVILTTFDRDDYLFDSLRAGASGFLLKNSEPEELVAAIRRVADGHALLAPQVTRRVIERYAASPPAVVDDSALADLTEREREVLVLMGKGLSNGEIADHLVLGAATIKTHVSRVLAKTGARDRVQAVVLAYETGLVGRDAGPTSG